MPPDIPSVYSPETAEAKWYDFWEKQGFFSSKPDAKKPPFTIVIPPPNVTGSLHMGHALNNTLQDILIRWRRMSGDNTLWIPGTDHGGIATQNVVERILKKEGKSRHDLGREAFLERMWSWRKESGDTILHQLRKLGSALDWSRARFTMDEECSKAVAAAFLEFYSRGLIYRGRRLVNWCHRCHTALSDIEVEYVEAKGKLWHIRYPAIAPGGREVVVATTRPETMLGDTAVAVHPDDPRYKDMVGKILALPLVQRAIPVVADAAVDSAFGSGAVKVTPSHDPTDFDIASRHKLPHEMVIGYDGRMTDLAGKYAGQTAQECRKNVVADLAGFGFLVKEEDHKHSVGSCYRCGTVIEPLESSQWFMKMSAMAARAAQATDEGRVRISPASWEKPYLHWLRNIRDWCISRQIWWGHRIPVWYCLSCGKFDHDQRNKITLDMAIEKESTKMILRESAGDPIVQEKKPAACPRCGSRNLAQDPDVLDTWFSSGLWPLATLGWPQMGEDLAYHYPTSVLVTGHEILYLWVARMVMMGQELVGKVPYGRVFIHGIVRDKQGRKMSKSLNNVIDPLDVMKKFGTDALRFALASSAVPGRDMQLSDDSFVGARNFANKMWNASRFVMMNLEGHVPADIPLAGRDLADRWIRRRLQDAYTQVNAFLLDFNAAAAARVLYDFFWGNFCDWYIELSKLRLQGTNADAKRIARQTLTEVLDGALRLLHPFMPFITEELWQALNQVIGSKPAPSLMAADYFPFPLQAEASDDADGKTMSVLMGTVAALRTLRSEMNVPPGKPISVTARVGAASALTRETLQRHGAYVKHLAKVSDLALSENGAKPRQAAAAVVGDFEMYVPLEGLIDFGKEKARLQKELAAAEQDLGRLAERLSNPDFSARAPKEEVDKALARRAETEARRLRLQGHIAALE